MKTANNKKRIIFLILLVVVIVLGTFFQLPKMIYRPSEMLGVELNKPSSSYSDTRVKLLIWLGGDASSPLLLTKNDENNPYNFILINAVLNKRIDVIPLLKADYSEQQEALAYEQAKEDESIVRALDELFKQ